MTERSQMRTAGTKAIKCEVKGPSAELRRQKRILAKSAKTRQGASLLRPPGMGLGPAGQLGCLHLFPERRRRAEVSRCGRDIGPAAGPGRHERAGQGPVATPWAAPAMQTPQSAWGRPCQPRGKASRGHAALPIVQGQPRRREQASRKPLVTKDSRTCGPMCDGQTGFLVNYFSDSHFPLLEGEVPNAGFCVG